MTDMWVTSDKTHHENNESAVTLIADMPGDVDFRRNGPTTDISRWWAMPTKRVWTVV